MTVSVLVAEMCHEFGLAPAVIPNDVRNKLRMLRTLEAWHGRRIADIRERVGILHRQRIGQTGAKINLNALNGIECQKTKLTIKYITVSNHVKRRSAPEITRRLILERMPISRRTIVIDRR